MSLILSVSRRTDIPAFYTEWFLNRLREGYLLVRNPRNPRQVSRISLSKDVVDGIVFWTKNPAPLIERVGELSEYPYYFQITLTAYGPEVERGVPSKNKVIIPAFQALSKKIGRERVIWRYDPIFFNEKYTMEYHTRCFGLLLQRLAGYTEKCTVSFMDFYKKTERNAAPLKIVEAHPRQKEELLKRLAQMAREAGIKMDACAEEDDYSQAGVGRARCIDGALLERISGYALKLGKDPNQRPVCGCAASIDVGAYDTCGHGCLYCYANRSPWAAVENMRAHDPHSPLLFGTVGKEDVVKTREIYSCREEQLRLFP